MLHRLAGWAGLYSRWRHPRWREVRRLIFVCKGNICRSAYAHALAENLGTVEVTSMGLEATAGAPADRKAQACASRRGTELGAHRAQPVPAVILREGDLIVGFEPAHLRILESLVGNSKAQMTLLGQHAASGNAYTHDPYGLDELYFDRCFREIESGVARIVAQLKEARDGGR